MSRAQAPLDNCYWLEPGKILAGEYPGGRDEKSTAKRLRRLLDAGVSCFLDLTEPDEREPYELDLPGPYAPDAVLYLRKPIPDHGLPAESWQMTEILDELDAALGEGRVVYLHCRAGIGRTNLVAGCWLTRSGMSGEAALARLNELWPGSGRSQDWPTIPETAAQVEYVRLWQEARAPRVSAADTAVASTLRDRYRGLMLGLAVGDALGQAVCQRKPGQFTPVGDLLGGGPFDLPRGAWSDETAMALCLATSLVECVEANAEDQLARYLAWQREGACSSTGQCIGISAATAKALATAQWSGNPLAGSHDPARPGKEPLARIGPAVAHALADPVAAIESAVAAARITHQAPLTLDAVRYFAGLLAGALQGASKQQLLAPMFSPVTGLWESHALKAEVAAVAAGSWVAKAPPRIFGGGQAVEALEATLWAFNQGKSLKECLLLAVNLGGDADTTAAMVGQLAGAHYGAAAMPAPWRNSIVQGREIEAMADRLLEASLRNITA